jgi:hypothetical protein
MRCNATCRRILVCLVVQSASPVSTRLPVHQSFSISDCPDTVHLIDSDLLANNHKKSWNSTKLLSDGFPVRLRHLVDRLGTSSPGWGRSCACRLDGSPEIKSVMLIRQGALHHLFVSMCTCCKYVYMYVRTILQMPTVTSQACTMAASYEEKRSCCVVSKLCIRPIWKVVGASDLRVAQMHQERLEQPG